MGIFTAKNAGIAFMIVGGITLIGAALTIILPLAGVEGLTRDLTYYVLLAAGEFITGGLYFYHGKRVNDGLLERKTDVLAELVRVIGVTAIISGVFTAVATVWPDMDLGSIFTTAISSIVLGVILLVVSFQIKDGRRALIDKAVWTVLLIAFMLLFLLSIMEILAVDNVVSGAVGVLTYVFMVIILYDPEVEVSMGIRSEEIADAKPEESQ